MGASRDEYLARQRQQLEDLHSIIADEINRVSTGAEWQDMVRTAAKFHQYSFRNALLILVQSHGKATLPASYTTWKKLNRYVRKGEKGLRILAPVIRRSPFDRETQQRLTKDEAKKRPPGSVIWRSDVVSVKPVSVFDVSQTEGKPLPQPPEPVFLEGGVPDGLQDKLPSIVLLSLEC
ncbi:ArdC family protein [Flaviflexus massiliensis]|uniref:ArdC family protein n=1 Tax=Flaviflexus massiliensis TaxID=1522309 RepID=UPI0006D5A625|nr:ArdC family protein [Flaviflexus massiliensis]